MKYLLALIALIAGNCHPAGTYAQSFDTGSATYAVVIGISDYQEPLIPDLRFADRDAEAFANYLRSPSGGNVRPENLQLLTNEKATMAQMVAALDWLMTVSEENDLAMIYFSGHGDVETKTRSQLGFLLGWDAPAHAYMARAFPVFYLQEIVSTISLDKKSKVLLVTDACRAGKLAGNAVGGAQLTSANLAKSFANEVKILSCQSNEYSYEGEQWGGGRGVFSFYLVDGMYGLADKNADATVNLFEIGRYLEDHVANEVAPNSQLPMIIGSKTEVVAMVDQPTLVRLKAGESVELMATSERISNSPKAGTNTIPPALQQMQEAFQASLGKNFDFNQSDLLCRLLLAKPELAEFHADYKRKLAAAIQDEVNQALNALLQSDPNEVNKFLFNPENYEHYPALLQRSIELVGEGNLITPSLKVKKLFFEAYNVTRMLSESDKFDKTVRDSLREVAHQLIGKAIAMEPTAAWLYYENGYFYGFRTPSQIDSIQKYCDKALELSPSWILPMLAVASEYMYNLNDYQKAETWLLRAKQADPASFVAIERLAWLYQTIGPKDKAMQMADEMIALRPDLFNGYGTKGGNYFQRFDFLGAKKWYEKAVAIDNSPTIWVQYFLGYVYMATGDVDKGKALFERMMDDERTPYWLEATYQTFYAKGLINFTKDLPNAEQLLDSALVRRHIPYDIAEILVWQAKAKFLQNKTGEARQLLERALSDEKLYISAFILGYSLMGDLEAQAGNDQVAEAYFNKGINFNGDEFFKEEAHYRYGVYLLKKDRLEEAEKQFQLCQYITNNHGCLGEYGLALLNAKQGKNELALFQLNKALAQFYPAYEAIESEPLFSEIRKTAQFKELMKQYFNQD